MAWLGPIIGAGLGLVGAGMQASAANRAASNQVSAANYAAYLQNQAANRALTLQEQQWLTTQAQMTPFVQAGQSGTVNLASLLGIAPSSWSQPGTNPYATMPAQGGPVINGGTPRWTGGGTPPQMGANGLPAGTKVIPTGNGFRWQLPPGWTNMSGDTSQGFGDQFWIPPGGQGGNGLPQGGNAAGLPQVRTEQNTSLAGLINPSLGAPGSLMQPFGEKFQAPTGLTEQNDPGFQARLDLGRNIIERSAAARGGALSGGTLKDLNQYAQDYASSEYGNTYNRAWNEYANKYNQFEQNRAFRYNTLANAAGLGQMTAGQLGTFGANAATNIGNTGLYAANAIGNNAQTAAYMRGSGYAAGANAWGGGLTSLGTLIQQLLMKYGQGGNSGIPQYDPVSGTYPS